MTPTTEHDEPDEMRCEWEWREGIEGYTTDCGKRVYDIKTTCPGCGLRVREIEGEGVEDA